MAIVVDNGVSVDDKMSALCLSRNAFLLPSLNFMIVHTNIFSEYTASIQILAYIEVWLGLETII